MTSNTNALAKQKYNFFTSAQIRPEGWMKRQLRIEADGLAGNLDKVWRDVRDSMWIGGDSDSWERVPYWLDGFIPLAYLLDDDDMKSRAQKYVDKIIESQCEDGWICPCTLDQRGGYDMWALILLAKVLVVYHDCTQDRRIEPLLIKAMRQFNSHLDEFPLFSWGASRWFECLIPIFWLYERTGENFLIDLARKMRLQGLDWEAIYADWKHADAKKDWTHVTHVVNQGMMLKTGALYARLTGEDGVKFGRSDFADDAWTKLMDAHGACYGIFTGDECLAGKSPIQGTELCAVVEAMYSFEWLYVTTGDNTWMDRLEYLAFNALPAGISPDMWTHQYDQMANQVQCSLIPQEKVPFFTNGPESNMFGLEPNFGCCTANFGQGYPKLALSAFMKSDGGIVSSALIPASVVTTIDGINVEITLDTMYPFRDTLTYTVSAEKDVTFDFGIRIPAYVKSAKVNGNDAKKGEVYVISREWRKGVTTVTAELSSEFVLNKSDFNEMRYLTKGALLYTVAIDEKWNKIEYVQDGVDRTYPYCDYEIIPQSSWNYAFASDGKFEIEEHGFDLSGYIFSPENAPVSVFADMSEIEWDFDGHKCAAIPAETAVAAKKVKLIPYGCSSLHMTMMPLK